MKRYVLLIISAVLCLILSSCTPADEYPFSPIAIEKRFGDSMEEVIEDLSIDLSAAEVVEQSEDETDITMRNVPIAEGQTAIVMLSFYKDILYIARYVSYDIEFTYDYAIAMYDNYTEEYGEDITYSGWPDVRSNISKEKFLDCAGQPGFVGRWKVQNRNISKLIFDGEDTKYAMRAESAVNTDGVNIAHIILAFEPLSQLP